MLTMATFTDLYNDLLDDNLTAYMEQMINQEGQRNEGRLPPEFDALASEDAVPMDNNVPVPSLPNCHPNLNATNDMAGSRNRTESGS